MNVVTDYIRTKSEIDKLKDISKYYKKEIYAFLKIFSIKMIKFINI